MCIYLQSFHFPEQVAIQSDDIGKTGKSISRETLTHMCDIWQETEQSMYFRGIKSTYAKDKVPWKGIRQTF